MIKIHVAASRQYDVILNKGILSMTGMYVKDALGLQDDPITGKLKNKKSASLLMKRWIRFTDVKTKRFGDL